MAFLAGNDTYGTKFGEEVNMCNQGEALKRGEMHINVAAGYQWLSVK